ncbi:mannosyl-oligosaccharide glucosidase-like [Tubulanus polymorphus]|uniref:mannosyl-oligosaccharide glucosidase-like n=1 Tax=Tubulanus polymorphus TaxID=672921 RepID=UPI003DA425CB
MAKGEARKRNNPKGSTQATQKNQSDAQEAKSPPTKNKSSLPNLMKQKKKKQNAAMNLDDFRIIFGIIGVLCIFMIVGYVIYQNVLKERIRKPLGVIPIIAHNATSASVDPRRFWGSYRPGNYFGMKTRSPNSPVAGLMWIAQHGQPKLRHWCDHGDGLRKYGWVEHDGINFGVQDIVDDGFELQTKFVKQPGGNHGGDWTAKISAKSTPGREKSVLSLIFYFALDGEGILQPIVKKKQLVGISGKTKDLGEFKMEFTTSSTQLEALNYLYSYAPTLKDIKDTVFNSFELKQYDESVKSQYIALGGHVMAREHVGKENIIAFQVTTPVPFEMEVIFESGSVSERRERLAGKAFTRSFKKHQQDFHSKFENVFKLEKAGYNSKEIAFAKAALSNMLGGVGYFYGSSIVQSVHNEKPISYWQSALYTGVPSRSFFPRGFLWDEGFHNLLISKWNSEISKDIIGHWLDLMNVEGWIPREQILGDEARARVPGEFVVQKNLNANPPTFFLPLKQLVKEMIKSSKSEDKTYLENLFPRLKAWFNWYNVTQSGSTVSSYRWHGRDAKTKLELNPKTLTSGLDDYPRASHPTDDERHVDLRCWMALAAGIMADVAKSLGQNSEEYIATYNMLTDNRLLDEFHWCPKTQRYCDYGLHTDQARLQRPKPPKNLQPGHAPPQHIDLPKERFVLQEPKPQFITSYGYVSLFPFLLQILEPNSPKLNRILKDITKPDLLWTPYGLRSLARNSPFYKKFNTEHDPPYWRGNIWINLNYLAVRALNHYASVEGPSQNLARDIYKQLRDNIVKNIYKEYERTGYIWENYDDMSGEGKGTHPFTGWSALVVLMMAENY